jgi:uncharacterized protein with ParB-like and HNH nuclease domain
MSNKIRIKADKKRLSEYIEDFEKGNLQVPAFQRDFVWTNEQKLELFNSINKGYPIGSIILWHPDFENEENYNKFGGKELGSYLIPPRSNDFFYIIDGFQRLSTLIGSLLHPEKAAQKGIKRNESDWQRNFNIVYNLKDEQFEINRSKGFDKLDFYQIPVYKLVDGKEFFTFQRELSLFETDINVIENYISRYAERSLIFQNYEIPSINLYDGSITESIEIFQRLNSTGSRITADWVVSARGIGKDKDFRFGTEIDNLLESDLGVYNFKNVKREVVLQCITNSFGGFYFDQVSKNNNKKLEVLVDRDDFIPTTKKTFTSIAKAVKFLYEDFFVLDSKLLPYNNHLIFVTDFFNKIENPTQFQLNALKKWLWVTIYSNYFTIYNLSKQRLAYQEFQKFIDDENHNPIYYDNKEQTFDTLNFPVKIEMGSVRAKALALFMLQYQVKEEKLDVNVVDGYKTFKLFNDIEVNSNISENTILLIDDKTYLIPKMQKDLSNWLKSDDDYSKFFINSEMKTAFSNGVSKEDILEMRKKLIIEAEKSFVESPDFHYNLNYIE